MKREYVNPNIIVTKFEPVGLLAGSNVNSTEISIGTLDQEDKDKKGIIWGD